MKCGLICPFCKFVNEDKCAFLSTKCGSRAAGHVMVESRWVCRDCYHLGDDLASFKSHACFRALDFGESETETKPKEPTVEPKPEPKADPGLKRQLLHSMGETEKELKRLKILKQLELERQQLAELVAKKREKNKNKPSSSSIHWGYGSTI